jgi:hypothetical protein
MTYKEFCDSKNNDPDVNMFPKGTTSDEALGILSDAILGPNWYVSYPAGKTQINTEIVAGILHEYEYRKKREEVLFRALIIVIILSLVCILGPMIIY